MSDSKLDDANPISLDRRRILSGAALASAVTVAGLGAAVQAEQGATLAPTRVRGKIDVHHHYLGASYVKTMGRERIAGQSASGTIPDWTPQVSLKLMDDSGIESAILSVSAPGVGMATPQATARLARQCNDEQAAIVRDHPGRFGAFAAIPLPDIDMALKEIEYALDTLHMDGIGFMTNYDGVHVGDPKFWPVFEEIQRRNAVAFFHPTSPFNFKGVPNVSVSTLEFPFDTTRAIVSMLVHGTQAKFPRIRMIWSHAGGAIASMAGRINTLSARHPKWVQKGPDFLTGLGNFYYDITQSTSPGTYAALSAMVGTERLMFGSDVPFAAQSYIDASLADFESLKVSHKDYVGLSRANAEKLFPRLAA